MDQVTNRSAVGSDDITDDTPSVLESRWSSDEENSSDFSATCLGSPPAPLPYYKLRLDEFRKIFKDLPESERLVVDYTCALQQDILHQGRLYLSENWVCFYSHVFRGTKITLPLKNVKSMSREKTARLIPNAIRICTENEKFFFSSFSAREKSFLSVFRTWQNTLLNKVWPTRLICIDELPQSALDEPLEAQTARELADKPNGDPPLTCTQFWQTVRQHYGFDLGLSHEEMENLHTSESNMQHSLTAKPGGDDSHGRAERPPSLRISGVEHVPLETSTPQGEEFPSLIGSPNSGSMDEGRSSPSLRRSPVPSLDRFTPERFSKRSSLSLDLNANENGVSERSGSESIEEAEERVGLAHQVSGRQYLNKVFHISANKMFDLLFTDSGFIRRFLSINKISNPSFTAWQKDASGNRKRSLNYTITINNPLIGKFSTATENQTLYKESRDGQYYLVDSEVYTHDVPYHDYFYTQNRYYILRSSKRKCRLRVYTDVKYKKQPWGLIKSFITKNSWSGIEDYFRQLEAELLEEEAEINQGGGESGKMGVLRRRRRAYSRSQPEHVKPNKPYGPDLEQHRDVSTGHMEMKGPYRWNITTIVAGMSVILLILTLLNLGLFVKLWAMEDAAHRMYLSTKHRLRERSEASLASEYGPKPIPGIRTREEMQLLKTVLEDSINLLQQLRTSLQVLQQNFALANLTTATR